MDPATANALISSSWVERVGIPFVVVLVLVFFILRREASYLGVVDKLAGLIENNTKAMVSFGDLEREQVLALGKHDNRAACVEVTVRDILHKVKEIDEKVEELVVMVRAVASRAERSP